MLVIHSVWRVILPRLTLYRRHMTTHRNVVPRCVPWGPLWTSSLSGRRHWWDRLTQTSVNLATSPLWGLHLCTCTCMHWPTAAVLSHTRTHTPCDWHVICSDCTICIHGDQLTIRLKECIFVQHIPWLTNAHGLFSFAPPNSVPRPNKVVVHTII